MGKIEGEALRFIDNKAGTDGGGMYLATGREQPFYLSNCTFVRNHAPQRGYALVADSVQLTLARSLMQANYGFGHGWEDECVESNRAEALQRLKEYRENAPRYSYRIKRYRG